MLGKGVDLGFVTARAEAWGESGFSLFTRTKEVPGSAVAIGSSKTTLSLSNGLCLLVWFACLKAILRKVKLL